MRTHVFLLWSSAIMLIVGSCQRPVVNQTFEDLPPEFKAYWYSGVAELNSYEIEQVRYGESRRGTSVLVFVTEPFSRSKLVKVDQIFKNDISVLKMNFTKKFITGIYPYSMMTSVFHPVWQGSHALKASSSIQEWCGMTYTELLNLGEWDIKVSSYFEDESEHKKIGLTWLEDELWTQIRINPVRLPLGDLNVIPGLFYQRMMHVKTDAYSCTASMTKKDGNVVYVLKYPDLDRTLEITFMDQFPYSIQGWKESYPDGGELRTSSGQLFRQIKSAYWTQIHNKDTIWRDSLFK